MHLQQVAFCDFIRWLGFLKCWFKVTLYWAVVLYNWHKKSCPVQMLSVFSFVCPRLYGILPVKSLSHSATLQCLLPFNASSRTLTPVVVIVGIIQFIFCIRTLNHTLRSSIDRQSTFFWSNVLEHSHLSNQRYIVVACLKMSTIPE